VAQCPVLAGGRILASDHTVNDRQRVGWLV
jgi:hypothetical protein